MEGDRKREMKPVYVDRRIHGLSLFSSLVEHVGMDHLHQPVVVPVVHRYSDDHGSLHREGFLERGRNLIGVFNPHPSRAESLGKSDHVNGAELDAGSAAGRVPLCCG